MILLVEVGFITNLIIKMFVYNYKDTDNVKTRNSYGKLAGVVGVIINLMLSIIKFVLGAITGSIAIIADAINNLFDVTAACITLVGFKLASRPADKEHPYGHARIEYITGLIIAIMIFLVGFELVQSSINKIINPTEIKTSILVVIILALSMFAKFWLMFFYKSIANKIDSETLKATAADCRNDVLSTGAVLFSLIILHITKVNIDAYIGLLVAGFIIYSAIGIVKDVTNPLLGIAPTHEFTKHITDKILQNETILGVHDLIIHDYGPGRRFGSVHVEIDSKVDPIKSHYIIDEIERDFFENDNITFVIHYDPVLVGDKTVERYKEKMMEKLKDISPLLSLHDFRIVDNKTYVNLIFDVVAPFELKLTDEEIKNQIQTLVAGEEIKINTMVTVDREYNYS